MIVLKHPGAAPAPTREHQWDAIYDLQPVVDEFRTWQEAGAIGVPSGWVVRDSVSALNETLFLLQRTEGGWATMRRVFDDPEYRGGYGNGHKVEHSDGAQLGYVATSLGDLHRKALAYQQKVMAYQQKVMAEIDPGFYDESGPLFVLTRRNIVAMYDPADPIQAAEAVLVAMGAPITVMPPKALEIASP